MFVPSEAVIWNVYNPAGVSFVVVNVAVAGIGLVLPLFVTGGALNETPAGVDPVYFTVNETVKCPL
jgi:hypothetical protein